jgi:hypothetical protein
MRGIKRSSKKMPRINSLFKIKSLVQHAPMTNGMLGTSRMVRGSEAGDLESNFSPCADPKDGSR